LNIDRSLIVIGTLGIALATSIATLALQPLVAAAMSPAPISVTNSPTAPLHVTVDNAPTIPHPPAVAMHFGALHVFQTPCETSARYPILANKRVVAVFLVQNKICANGAPGSIYAISYQD
jgi:hypothetical protein